jgi:predicted transcriptional regulator
MDVQLDPELERRLRTAAQRRSKSVSQLIEEAMISYLDAVESEPSSWVEATQSVLPKVWPAEDFSDWNPPDGR